MIRNVWADSGKLTIRGVKKDKVRGRSAFKLPALLSQHFSGKGDDYIREGGKVGALATFYGMIDHTQRLFDEEDIVFRVLGECGGWPFVQPGAGMFGAPARDQGIHDVASYRLLCRAGDRVKELTLLNRLILEELFKASETTGCVFEYVTDATLKHTDGLCNGIIDHVIRQTAVELRVLQEKYPRAAFIFSCRNEWEVLNNTGHTLPQVNQWANRFYRWKHADPAVKPVTAFESPGPEWTAEQWPGGFCIVDEGGSDVFSYDVGPEPGKFKLGAVHPRRKGGGWVKRSDWWDVSKEWMAQLRTDARGQPVGFTESMYFVSKAGTDGWYRNRNGWNDDIALQLKFYEQCEEEHGPDLWYVHDDVGVQSDPYWNPDSRWEAALAEFMGGVAGGGPPPPPPGPKQVTYALVIAYAFREILGREPDRGGLESYDAAMRAGLSEANMRESLLRSREFAEKNQK